jgi:predicted transcriptional regulator
VHSANASPKNKRIARIAVNDPFLTIEEIAEEVQTTKRYVRSTLSEKSLSLMKMRNL